LWHYYYLLLCPLHKNLEKAIHLLRARKFITRAKRTCFLILFLKVHIWTLFAEIMEDIYELNSWESFRGSSSFLCNNFSCLGEHRWSCLAFTIASWILWNCLCASYSLHPKLQGILEILGQVSKIIKRCIMYRSLIERGELCFMVVSVIVADNKEPISTYSPISQTNPANSNEN
jgi:hypothetical protein